MKNCSNCGAPIDPYRVKCEYCGTMYFDWATWLQEGKPCFINYRVDSEYDKRTIVTKAIPHLEQVEINDEPTYITDLRGNVIHRIINNRYCDLHVIFTCVADQRDESLFKMVVEE